MSEYCHNCKNLAGENAKLKRHNDILVEQREQACDSNAALVELLESAMYQGASLMSGWYDTCAISTWRDIGERLVGLGRWERRGEPVGRRGFYRPMKKGGGDE